MLGAIWRLNIALSLPVKTLLFSKGIVIRRQFVNAQPLQVVWQCGWTKAPHLIRTITPDNER